MKIILTKFEVVDGNVRWTCQQENCSHSSEFMTVAIFHQHDTHNFPMENVKLSENNTQLIMFKRN